MQVKLNCIISYVCKYNFNDRNYINVHVIATMQAFFINNCSLP